MTHEITEELFSFQNVFDNFTKDSENINTIQKAAEVMIRALKSGNKIISIGNGGSMSDAMHFASELSGRYRQTRPAIAAMALSDPGALTCIANDFGYNQVFKRQLEAIGNPGDVLLALSTSGNSENVLVAAEHAQRVGIKVVSISGQNGQLKQYTNALIEIPHIGTADRIQEMTIIIIHIIVSLIEKHGITTKA